jgi:hypothetical protein
MSSESPFEITRYVENANLRDVSWNERFLSECKEEHHLRHRQAVLYVNKAQDRFRLVANFFGMAVLVLTPIDPEDRTSLYLKISRYLKKFRIKFADGIKFLDAQIETAQTRIKRRQAAARKAKSKRAA